MEFSLSASGAAFYTNMDCFLGDATMPQLVDQVVFQITQPVSGATFGLQGQSRNSYNFVAFYEKDRIQTRLAYPPEEIQRVRRGSRCSRFI